MTFATSITLTLLATTVARVGIVLLKQAVADVTAAGRAGFFPLAKGLATSARGAFGVFLEIVGYGLFLFALSDASAPISILQPVRAFGIVVMAFLSVVFLGERLRPREWVGIALQLAGILLLGMTPPREPDRTIDVSRLLTFLSVLTIVGAISWWLPRSSPRRRHLEFCSGALAGILLGIAYLHTKVLFMAIAESRPSLVVLSVVAMAVGAIGGLAVLLESFRECRALIVTTINFVLNQILVIVGGAFCLGESFPSDPFQLAARVLGIGCIMLGVVLLSRFQESQSCSRVRQNAGEPA